jgi:hypothetical protein
MPSRNRGCFFESISDQGAGIDIFLAIVNLLSPSSDIAPAKVRRTRIWSAETSVHKTKKARHCRAF